MTTHSFAHHTMAQPGPTNSPPDYMQDEVERVEAMRTSSTPEEFCRYLRLMGFKYLWRPQNKDTLLNNVRRAQWYINTLLKELEATPR